MLTSLRGDQMESLEHRASVVVVERPRPSLGRNGVVACLILSLTLIGAITLIDPPVSRWPSVLGSYLVTLVVMVVAYVQYRRTSVGVVGPDIIERGYFGVNHRIKAADVTRIVFHQTYRSHATDSTMQLIALDSDGRRMLRMRGMFWTDASIHAIAKAIGAPVENHPDPIIAAEFFDAYPGSAYWFENRPWVVVVGVIGVFLVTFATVLGLMALLGIPIGFGA